MKLDVELTEPCGGAYVDEPPFPWYECNRGNLEHWDGTPKGPCRTCKGRGFVLTAFGEQVDEFMRIMGYTRPLLEGET